MLILSTKLLRDIRDSISTLPPSPSSPLGIKPLDDLLRIWHFPPASYQQQQYSAPIPLAGDGGGDVSTTAALEPSRNTVRLKRSVVEITSPSSGDGKTHLLYYIAAVAILPASFTSIHVGGRDGAVVFL